MTFPRTVAYRLLGLATILISLPSLTPAEDVIGAPDPVKIGMVGSLFTDVPPALIELGSRPFSSLMKEHTGMNGKLVVGGDAYFVAKQLKDDQIQLGVFHGVEFAWAQTKFPDLRPLMVAVYKDQHLTANLVVRKDTCPQGVPNIRGKSLAVPFQTKEHSRLFLHRFAKDHGKCDPKGFFGKITKPANFEKALDAVVNGESEAALVDNVALVCYQEVHPGRAAYLKVLKESEIFPTAVIAYRQGGLNPTVLNRFKEGMIEAKDNPRSCRLMALFKIDSFEQVPAEYSRLLQNIMKAYPPPEKQELARP